MPHRDRTGLMAGVAFALLAILPGCGDGAPPVDSSTTEATITGIVTYKGKPVEAGDIVFDPSNYLRKVGDRSAPIGADGHFTAKTYTGSNRIKVGGALLTAHPELRFMKKFMEVESGENAADIELVEGEGTVHGGKMPKVSKTARR
jgi:hypothetical protein